MGLCVVLYHQPAGWWWVGNRAGGDGAGGGRVDSGAVADGGESAGDRVVPVVATAGGHLGNDDGRAARPECTALGAGVPDGAAYHRVGEFDSGGVFP